MKDVTESEMGISYGLIRTQSSLQVDFDFYCLVLSHEIILNYRNGQTIQTNTFCKYTFQATLRLRTAKVVLDFVDTSIGITLI